MCGADVDACRGAAVILPARTASMKTKTKYPDAPCARLFLLFPPASSVIHSGACLRSRVLPPAYYIVIIVIITTIIIITITITITITIIIISASHITTIYKVLYVSRLSDSFVIVCRIEHIPLLFVYNFYPHLLRYPSPGLHCYHFFLRILRHLFILFTSFVLHHH